MKKQFLFSTLILFLAFTATCFFASCNNNVEPEPESYIGGLDENDSKSFTLKEIPVINGQSGDKVALRYYEDFKDIAYISVSDYHKMMTGNSVTVKKSGFGQYELSHSKGNAKVNTKSETFSSDDYLAFLNLMDFTQKDMANVYYDGFPYCRFKSVEYSPQTVPVTLDYGKYNIDLRGDDEAVYFPFITLDNLYSDLQYHRACFNGEEIVVIKNVCEDYPIPYDEDFAKANSKPERTEQMAEFSYNNLCFTLDNFYGQPGREQFNKLRQIGLEGELSALGSEGECLKGLLKSLSIPEYFAGIKLLDYFVDDGGHTSLVYHLSGYSFDFENNPEVKEQWDSIYNDKINYFQKFKDIYYKNIVSEATSFYRRKQNSLLRAEKYGNNNTYQKSGQTAICFIDNFLPSKLEENYYAWKNFYNGTGPKPTLDEYPDDTILVFYDALEKACADPEIKNFVIDITLNTGGSADQVVFLTSLMYNKAEVYSRNMLTNQIENIKYDIDRNLDGKFDADDEKPPFENLDKLNFVILQNKTCFSCGNLFPSLAKDNGIMVIGETSGGGACAVQYNQTGEGYAYQISSCRSHLVNKNGQSIDSGVEPDFEIPFENPDNVISVKTKNDVDTVVGTVTVHDYSKFYDAEYLNTLINTLNNKE